MFSAASQSHHSPFSNRYYTTGYSEPKLYVKKTKKTEYEKCCSDPVEYLLRILLCYKI